MTGSHTHRRHGTIKKLITADMIAPLAIMEQILLTISILDTIVTPSVAQNSTHELVIMEGFDVEDAMIAASTLSFPFLISSLNLVDINIA